jgi:hypothetical protein
MVFLAMAAVVLLIQIMFVILYFVKLRGKPEPTEEDLKSGKIKW